MENFLIYGVFLFAILCYPAYFWIQYKKRRQEQAELLQKKMEQDSQKSEEDGEKHGENRA